MITEASTAVLQVERTGSLVWLTLNRPSKCNALDVELNTALTAACKAIPADATVVVLRGAGKHFCAGSDLKDLYKVDRAEARRVIQLEIDACYALAALPQLTIALLHGKCYGGGAMLPLFCDLRIGVAGVDFALPEVALGWVPPYGIDRMAALVPHAFTMDLLLSGRTCGDAEALQQGLLSRITATSEDAQEYIRRIAEIPSQTLLDTVSLTRLKQQDAMRVADSVAFDAFLDHFDTDNARSKINSFMEKRK